MKKSFPLTLIVFIISFKLSQSHESHAFTETRLTTIKFYHSIGAFDDYKLRGSIILPASRDKEVSIKNEPLSANDLQTLQRAGQDRGLYYLKAVAYKNNDEPTKTAHSFTDACSLVASTLTDMVVLSLDHNGDLISVSEIPSDLSCSNVQDLSKTTSFNTTVKVVSSSLGPVPDTQSYIQRMEQEKVEKMKGERADNRSFLAKYWMYIIPLVLILLVSSTSSSEGQ